MQKRMLIITAMAVAALCAQAKVRLPHIIGDNMVLQQCTEARLWGWDQPGKKVNVSVSWDTQKTYTAKTGKDGRWMVKVQTPKASYTPLSITFDDGEPLTISGVLSGEVWVCAGQSNMEMPVKGFGQCPVEGYNDEVINARNYKGIHYVKIPSVMSMTPLDDANCEWKEVSAATVGEASATGYFFAQVVNKALDIPVGLVMANKGGTRVESWLTKENLQKYTQEPLDTMGIVNGHEWDYHRQLVWGNGTFNPILNYTVKGIIFYQGCSNVGDPGDQYSERLHLLVRQWREQFGLGEIPFYFVEIAPYNYSTLDGDNGARLREQQYKASTLIPNSGLVCTNDLAYPYESSQIHPTQKKPVGQRLAYLALNQTYGMTDVWCKSPSFKDMKINGGTIDIHLNDDYGSISRFEDIQGFEVAGDDHVFHPAKAVHFWQPGGGYWDETVRITCDEVPHPVALRYCFKNFQPGNLKNGAGLPLFPFRTDNW